VTETFRIEIVASPRQAEAGIARVDDRLEELNRTAASTNSLLKGALQIAGIGSATLLIQRAASALAEYADGYVQVQNQLAIVTRGTRELEQTTVALLGIANRSRSGFEETAKLYARTALATRELGISQTDLLSTTETINKAIILSGASAKEANNGLIQLSQAIASNRLAGDELRSVLEQLPVVADVIARQLGVTRGELRELGRDGEIGAKVILDGFRNAREEIEKRFARTVPTISQAFQILRNNVVVTVGELNKATGASRVLASTLVLLSRNLGLVITAGLALPAALSAGRIAVYVQGLFDAARESRALEQATRAQIAAGVLAGSTQLQEAQIAAAAAEADVQLAETALVAAEAQHAKALAVAEAGEAEIAQAAIALRAAQADLRSVQAQTSVLEAELARAQAVGVLAEEERVLLLVEQELLALRVRGEIATAQAAAAETALAEASAAAAAAQQGRALATAEIVALDTQLVAKDAALAAAQKTLNGTLATGGGLFSRLFAVLRANPFGVAAVGVGALVAALVGTRELLATVLDGVQLVVSALSAMADAVREVASSLPGVGQGLQTIGKFALVFGTAGAVFAGVTSGILITAAAVVSLAVALGQLKRAFDKVKESEDALNEARAIAPLGEEILASQRALKKLNEEFERTGDPSTAETIKQVTANLAQLVEEAKRIQGTDKRQKEIETSFTRRLAAIREETALLAKSRHERELELDVLNERRRIERESKTKLAPGQEDDLRKAVLERQAAEDLARILDEIEPPDLEFDRTVALLEEANLSADQFNRAMAILEQRRLDNSPLATSLGELQRRFKELSQSVPELLGRAGQKSAGTDASGRLEDLRAANREREVQVQLAQKLDELRAKGRTDVEIENARSGLEIQIRQNNELARQLDLEEQRLQLERDLADQAQVALLPDFQQDVERQIQGLRELNLTATDQAARAGEIRRNASLQELGGILNGLTEPSLALAQRQKEVADQIQRVNVLMATGAITAEQYAVAMRELSFRAQQLSTDFSDGIVVAFREAEASITSARIGAAAFNGVLDALGNASAEFVRTGTVDFKQYALNIIAELSKLITQYLVLAAAKAIAGEGESQGGSNFAGSLVTFTGSGFDGRQEGGPVRENQPYIVGERGPELFVPGRSGSVVPNDQVVEALARSGAGGGASQVVVPPPEVRVSVVNVTDPDQALDTMDSPAGHRVILNAIEKNPNRAKRALG
jgi:tape measure domain-containing protein